ncbi:hypothetical protein V6N11_001293 [Hibiscus sabdariffa]|uniref:Uncharacterized protein n=1 Tax=Hibiscus sabdariffa TaxID=183260 RepID=A0ABR2RZB8_9ROSI
MIIGLENQVVLLPPNPIAVADMVMNFRRLGLAKNFFLEYLPTTAVKAPLALHPLGMIDHARNGRITGSFQLDATSQGEGIHVVSLD